MTAADIGYARQLGFCRKFLAIAARLEPRRYPRASGVHSPGSPAGKYQRRLQWCAARGRQAAMDSSGIAAQARNRPAVAKHGVISAPRRGCAKILGRCACSLPPALDGRGGATTCACAVTDRPGVIGRIATCFGSLGEVSVRRLPSRDTPGGGPAWRRSRLDHAARA